MKKRTSVDWNDLRARLERSRTALATASEPGSERVQAIYRERAKRLARPIAESSPESEDVWILEFKMGTERYAFELSRLVEIIPRPRCAPVPGAPPQLAGVIQVRGEIRPVWDLSNLLGLPALADGSESVLLIRHSVREFGVRVGRVEGIRRLTPEDRRSEHTLSRVKWVTSELIAVLDADKLFDGEEL